MPTEQQLLLYCKNSLFYRRCDKLSIWKNKLKYAVRFIFCFAAKLQKKNIQQTISKERNDMKSGWKSFMWNFLFVLVLFFSNKAIWLKKRTRNGEKISISQWWISYLRKKKKKWRRNGIILGTTKTNWKSAISFSAIDAAFVLSRFV